MPNEETIKAYTVFMREQFSIVLHSYCQDVLTDEFHSSSLLRKLVLTRENVVKSPYPDVKLSKKTFFDFVWQGADQYPDRVAIVSLILQSRL